jgi:hypothetical protein
MALGSFAQKSGVSRSDGSNAPRAPRGGSNLTAMTCNSRDVEQLYSRRTVVAERH